MKKFNYKEAGKEIGWNFSKMDYCVERKQDFNYYQEVIKHIKDNTIMLDIGSGSAEQSIRYYNLAKKIHLTDLEPEMLKKAKANVKKYYEGNKKTQEKFKFKILNSNGPFDFKDDSFNLVVSRYCGANMYEVYRVLKSGGIFISEDVSSDDCQELKEIFKRGQGYKSEPLYKSVFNECVDAGFKEIKLIKLEETEYYKTIDDLKYLLNFTPILNGFDEEKDMLKLNEYVSKNLSSKGIKLNRKLYAFILKK